MSRHNLKLMTSFVGLSLLAFGASAAPPLTDAQVARFLYVAQQASEQSARLAEQKTQDARIKAFAAANLETQQKTSLALRDRFSTATSGDSFTDAPAVAASGRRKAMEKLSGVAFDKAYAENEVLYDLMIVGVLETTVAPATNDAALKTLVASELQHFKERQKRAEEMLHALN